MPNMCSVALYSALKLFKQNGGRQLAAPSVGFQEHHIASCYSPLRHGWPLEQPLGFYECYRGASFPNVVLCSLSLCTVSKRADGENLGSNHLIEIYDLALPKKGKRVFWLVIQ